MGLLFGSAGAHTCLKSRQVAPLGSSEGNKFKLSNSLTLPPIDVLVTK